jgi:hypothetical protein
MKTEKNYRWRKFTDINRENALFELLDDEENILDVGFTDEGILEVAFNQSIGGVIIGWSELIDFLNQGKALAESDR